MVKIIKKNPGTETEETKVSLTVGSFVTIILFIASVITAFLTLNAKVNTIDDKLDKREYYHTRETDSLKGVPYNDKMNKLFDKFGIK